MVDLNKLKGLMTEKNLTYSQGAEAIGCTTTTFCKKMNGKSQFTIEQAHKLSNRLDLPNVVRISIFLI